MKRRSGLPLIVALVLAMVLTSMASAQGNTPGRQKEPGDESHELMASLEAFISPRAAPSDVAPAAAWPAAVQYARQVKLAGQASWSEIGPRGLNSDDANYADPNFSNSGGGMGLNSGRMTAVVALKDGKTVFAGGAAGGIWKSGDGGKNWTPLTDFQESLSTGALALDERQDGSYTVYAGTGEANTSQDSYAGIGILKSTDGGTTWSRVGGDELLGATIYRIVVDPKDPGRLYAATSHGLYRWTSGATQWQRILGTGNSIVANMVTDVVVRPGTGGAKGDLVAVIGWRDGAPTNGIFESTNGGDTFTGPYNPRGYVSPNAQGRVSLAYSKNGDRLYAVVQDPAALTNPGALTILEGIYVSRNGDPKGPFTKIAESSKLMNSGSAQKVSRIGTGYQPGVQAWYNQFIVVDPTNADHLYVGLEEVYETDDGGVNWTTIGPYWNFPFACFSYNPFPGTCNPTTHPDQHGAYISNGILFVANDGGMYSRSVAKRGLGGWNNLNATLSTLQFYFAGAGQAASGPLTIYGGLQDNGTAKVIPGQLAAEPFGGDGGDVVVDPANPNRVMTEYTYLAMAKSIDGGKSWTGIAPADPNPRFIAPFRADPSNLNHLVAGGQYVWESKKGFDTVCNGTGCDWQKLFDQGTGHQTTALAVLGSTVYAPWCGPCNPNMLTGVGFKSGIATNAGGAWHQLTPPLPNRYPAAVTVDPANAAHAYVVYSGYSRHWILSPADPGVGHVFETNDGGATWTNISGDLVDAPGDDLVIVNGHLVVATDVGVFVSGLHGGKWERLGTGLPNVVVSDLTVGPGNLIIAATHGRGLWSIPAP